MNESFCAKTFEKFDFSDVTSDKNDEEEKKTKSFMMTLSSSVSQLNINFYADHHRLKIGLMNPSISLSDHLTHTQVKINLPTYYIETDGERLLTSDGRGSLPIIGSCSQENGIIIFSHFPLFLENLIFPCFPWEIGIFREKF